MVNSLPQAKLFAAVALASVAFMGMMMTFVLVPGTCHAKVQAIVVGSKALQDYGRCDITVEYDAYGETYTNTLNRLCANDTAFSVVRGCVSSWRPDKLRPYDTDDPRYMSYSAAISLMAVATVIAGAILAVVVWTFLPEKWRLRDTLPTTVQLPERGLRGAVNW